MKRRLIGKGSAGLALLSIAFLAPADTEPHLALSDAVLRGFRPLAEIRKELDPATDAACLQRYLQRIPTKSILWHGSAPRSAETALPVLRRNLAEQMKALLGAAVATEAKSLVQAMPLAVEWEGMAENPLAEAEFIAGWMAERPGTPLAPFLRLMLAHRFAAASSLAPMDHALGERYQVALRSALASEDPVIACLAREIQTRHQPHGRP